MHEQFRKPLSRRIAYWIATAGGVGSLSIAPGTWGSLVGGLAYAAAWQLPGPWIVLIGLGIAGGGLWATQVYQSVASVQDPGAVVIDEVLGMWVAAAFCSHLTDLLWVFLLFRFFDIAKLWPVSVLDQGSKTWTGLASAAGVIVDDLVAGLQAGFVFWALKSHTSILG